jgi:hypothetical protein
MRVVPALLVLALTSPLLAQTPGMDAAQQAQQAAQQAQQAAEQANQNSIRRAQKANEDAARASQEAAAHRMAQCCTPAARPKFSVQGGVFDKPVTVKIRESTRGAAVYYTTDGWTPTTASARYTGPITIITTTTLQAIAVALHMPRSRIAGSVYTIRQSGTATALQTSVVSPTRIAAAGVLPKGTAVPLIFAADYTSRKADVGDKVNLTLADNLKIGETIVVPKGTPAFVNVIEAHKAGPGGLPGFIALEAETLTVGHTAVKLVGAVAKEGREVSANPATIG